MHRNISILIENHLYKKPKKTVSAKSSSAKFMIMFDCIVEIQMEAIPVVYYKAAHGI